MKVLAEKDNSDVKEDDEKMKASPERKRHDSVDSEPMLTIDDSVYNDEHKITNAVVASELRI